MVAFTIDVSHHDWDRRGGNLDWHQVRAAGVEVVCIRATYGDPAGWHRDSRHFRDMARAARSAGLLVGAYHNLVRGTTASIARQVDWLRSEMDAVGAVWAMQDVERYPELLTAGMQPQWEDAREWSDRWAAVDSRVCAHYLPRWIWTGYLGRPDLRALRGPLVASRYPLGDATGAHAALYSRAGADQGPGWDAYGGVVPALWQFSSSASVPGANAKTDVNAFRGTVAQLRALLTREDDDVTPEQAKQLSDIWGALHAPVSSNANHTNERTLADLGALIVGGSDRFDDGTEIGRKLAAVAADVAALKATVALLAGKDLVDEEEIVKGVLAVLTPAAIADAIPAELAEQVVAALGAKLTSG